MAFLKTLSSHSSLAWGWLLHPLLLEHSFPHHCMMEDYFINGYNDTLSLVLTIFVAVLCNL